MYAKCVDMHHTTGSKHSVPNVKRISVSLHSIKSTDECDNIALL